MANILIQDFKKRFTNDTNINAGNMMDFVSVINPVINANDNLLLMQQVTDEEIYEAIKSIGGLKALGPDGLHAFFYQNC